ncbi:MAG: glycosyltransferase family 2 protein, partial [Phocaeicola sp.]
MNPLISIIMPVYQAEKYLHYSIPSVLQQTYSNIELILVNDGSTDQSASICDAFAAKDARIKVMHTTNNGQASARNRGIEIASGDFLGFIDNDDELFPDMCERLVANIKRESADISGASFIQKDESGHITRDNHNPEDYYVWENEEAMSNFLERKRMDIYVWTKIYRRDFLNNNAIRFREGIKSDEDVLFN